MFPTPIEKTSAGTQIAYKIALPIALIVWLLPLIAVMMTSVRSLADINQGNYWGWPTEIQFIENYAQVFTATPMTRYLINSVIVTVPTVIGTLAISTLAGTALALYRYRLAIPLFAMFIAGNFIPFQILMIPVRDLMVNLGMYDTYWSLILFHIAFQSGFCTLFMRNFIKALPFELIEAARVAGVSEFEILRRVVLPLVRPAIAALAVLVFTFIWNDFFWALVLVQSDEVRPITVGLNALRGQWVASWQLISAGSIVAALPPVLMFFAMQRHFIAGLTLGATKG
ncbi:MAG: carbohydrate ABC transporter permease [Geminicoccaceae bacterium]